MKRRPVMTEEKNMNLYPFFRSMAEADCCAVVICNPAHEIIYMNPAAIERYARWGGEKLLGRSLLDCHGASSREMIQKVTDWFRESKDHNRIYTSYNEKENKDVYMVALRDENGSLIGYYEKHEYRNRETETFYHFERN